MKRFITLESTQTDSEILYDVLVGAIQPRPIAFISTRSSDGTPNLAPFSYFMPGGNRPPSLAVSIAGRSGGRKKDTLVNIEATGEFVVNLLTRTMASGMNQTSAGYEHGESEWPASGFHTLASHWVQPDRVQESPIHLECRLFQIITHGSGPGCANYVIGEIVGFHVQESVWNGRTIDADQFRPISRMGGDYYLDTEQLELFELPRPQIPTPPAP